MSHPWHPFRQELRKMGFKKVWDSVSGGACITQYVDHIDARRTVEVQLWQDGNHRATHSIRGCSSTIPSGFTDVDGMVSAIRHEAERTDNKWFLAGTPLELEAGFKPVDGEYYWVELKGTLTVVRKAVDSKNILWFVAGNEVEYRPDEVKEISAILPPVQDVLK